MDAEETTQATAKQPTSRWMVVLIIIAIIFAALFFVTGFFVIQPIGAVPEGMTIWYYRLGTNMPFISSPDGLSLKDSGSVSLMGRMAAMGSFIGAFEDKIIARLGYSESLYLISTGGSTFTQ